ncbi:6-bladed beta-propeller [Desertivirga xinjiangensis]|uniref:6-bladed beta-propeller n=1 Tax=Desertivirga xinjiangensis TaxID=539206 RepID=UPI00210A2E95|nr:6-bladed beta-propeller [Pedobacter xinjiangensis]
MKIWKIFLSSLILASCKYYKTDVETIKISAESDKRKQYHEIAKISKLIPLATDSNCTIREISKICILKDEIKILDKKMSSIYTFDKEGRFLSKIAQLGPGVGKYMRIDDFETNSDGSLLEILDGVSNKIITYSGNKFLKEASLPFRADAFAFNQNKIIFHRDIAPYKSDLMYQIIVTDKNFQIIDKFVEIQTTSDLTFAPQNPLQRNEASISFLPIYSPDLFNITSEGVFEKYHLDFGKNWMTDNFIYSRKNPGTFISELSQSGYVYFLNTLEGDKYLTISFMLKNKIYTAVYNKQKKDLVFISDFNSSYCGDFGFQAYQNNHFIASIKAEQLLDSYKSGKYNFASTEVQKTLAGIKSGDNPIIMFTAFQF